MSENARKAMGKRTPTSSKDAQKPRLEVKATLVSAKQAESLSSCRSLRQPWIGLRVPIVWKCRMAAVNGPEFCISGDVAGGH